MNIEFFENEMFGRIRGMYLKSKNEMYFIGKDVCDVLEYKDPYNILKRYVYNEDKIKIDFDNGYGVHPTTFISIQGVYDLCLHSTMPKAREFQRWITHEVLMDIRKYGIYVGDNAPSVQVQRDAQGRRIAIDFDTNALLGQLEFYKNKVNMLQYQLNEVLEANARLNNCINAEAQAYGLSREDFEFVFGDRVLGPDGKYYKEMK